MCACDVCRKSFTRIRLSSNSTPAAFKSRLRKFGVRPVATGEAELGIGQASEIPLVPGVELLGPFPAELQSYTNVTAGIGTHAKEANGAKALIKFLTSPVALPVYKAKAFEPG